MADQAPKIAMLRSSLKKLREAPLMAKTAHAERVVDLTIGLLEEQGQRISVLERDVALIEQAIGADFLLEFRNREEVPR